MIFGVIVSLIWANLNFEGYHHVLEHNLLPGIAIAGNQINFHFLMNDIFMVFFFGIAAVEITQAVLPGGSLNPISRAINPLLGTLGGVLGPALFYLGIAQLTGNPKAMNGWGIPTATDIALAWLVARFIFGHKHSAVSFLLLLAVADDAIGLGIIAVFYPDPDHPVELQYLLLTLVGMLTAFAFRKANVKNFWLYIIICGGLSWSGLIYARLHPALALVFIIPFLSPQTRVGQHDELFEDETDDHSPMSNFEHSFKIFVDFGLFGFGLANAGVEFSQINDVTWIVFSSLLFGKMIGIFGFSGIGHLAGLKLPDGMDLKTLLVAALIAGLGLTVALFVAGQAFPNGSLEQAGAKMGALFSAGIAVIAWLVAIVLRIKKHN